MDQSQTFAEYNGEIYYFVMGRVAKGASGLILGSYYVTNGVVDRTMNGLVDGGNGIMYLIENGVANVSDYTGVFEQNGKLTLYKDGYVYRVTDVVEYNGELYYFVSGEFSRTTKGVVLGSYYVTNGIVDRSVNGFVKSEDGLVYLFENGVRCRYNDIVEYDGKLCLLYEGRIDYRLITGLYKVDGKLYYVVKGVVDTEYNGIVRYNKSSATNPEYIWCYVSNGVVDWNYNGVVEQDGQTYNVVYGVAYLVSKIETKEEVLAFYQNAAKDIAENGSAGYNKKAWQSIDEMNFTGSAGNLLHPIVEGFVADEESAEVKASEKGSDDAKNRMPMSNCTAAMVESATLETKGDNYLITIVMKEQVNPEKTDVDGIAVMSDNILYASDVIEIIETDIATKTNNIVKFLFCTIAFLSLFIVIILFHTIPNKFSSIIIIISDYIFWNINSTVAIFIIKSYSPLIVRRNTPNNSF
jgi:hypothetical protein